MKGCVTNIRNSVSILNKSLRFAASFQCLGKGFDLSFCGEITRHLIMQID